MKTGSKTKKEGAAAKYESVRTLKILSLRLHKTVKFSN